MGTREHIQGPGSDFWILFISMALLLSRSPTHNFNLRMGDQQAYVDYQVQTVCAHDRLSDIENTLMHETLENQEVAMLHTSLTK